jgi:hypothetical protein
MDGFREQVCLLDVTKRSFGSLADGATGDADFPTGMTAIGHGRRSDQSALSVRSTFSTGHHGSGSLIFLFVQISRKTQQRNGSQKRGFLRGYVEPEKLRAKVG